MVLFFIVTLECCGPGEGREGEEFQEEEEGEGGESYS